MLGFERTLCNRNENYTMKNVCEYGLLVERIHSVVIFFAVLVIWIEWRKCRKRGKRNVLIQNRNVSSEWEQRGRKERSRQQQQKKPATIQYWIVVYLWCSEMRSLTCQFAGTLYEQEAHSFSHCNFMFWYIRECPPLSTTLSVCRSHAVHSFSYFLFCNLPYLFAHINKWMHGEEDIIW